MPKQAVSQLYELMTKKGITPDYTLMDKKDGTHLNEFKMRVTCPITLNGPVFAADGCGSSKKEAKQEAALAFMKKFTSEYANNNPPVRLPVVEKTQSVCAVNLDNKNRHSVLQMLCIKRNLQKPEYNELEATGPPHSRNFTLQCRVEDLSTKGQGSTKQEAKLNATTKMIQLLLGIEDIYEIFESGKSITSTNGEEIICINDNLKNPQLPTPTKVFTRRKSDSSSLYSPFSSVSPSRRLSTCSRNSNTSSVVFKVFNDQKTVGCGTVNNDGSASNMSLIDFDNECTIITASTKARSKSLSNLFECANGETKNSKKITRQQTVSEIESTLEYVEKMLYDKILDNLQSRNKPVEKTVIILHHEYEIYIDACSDRPNIIEGDSPCADSSIRIACLSKLLMDLKDHVRSCN